MKILEHCEREFYGTLQEASFAARSLGIQNVSDYRNRYAEDSRLPCEPEKCYQQQWGGWAIFLGRRTGGIYPTIAQAKDAVRRLDLKNNKEYAQKYKQDGRLPASPRTHYPGEWKGWKDFLGTSFYSTIIMASNAAIELGIGSFIEYQAKRVQDSKLPCHPPTTYRKEWKRGGWTWPKFLGRKP